MGVGLAVIASAFTAGIATFFSPCAFPLLPGYISYYVGSVENPSIDGAMARGIAAGVGSLVVFVVLGVLGAVVGNWVVQRMTIAEPLIGALVVILGVFIYFDWTPGFTTRLPQRRSSLLGFSLFGGGYSIAAIGCFAPIFLAIVLRASTASLFGQVVLLLAFGLGTALLLVATITAAAVGYDVSYQNIPLGQESIRRVAGLIIVLAGAAQIYQSVQVL